MPEIGMNHRRKGRTPPSLRWARHLEECTEEGTLTSRDKLNGQRVMYPTSRSIPARSPAGRKTDWSTLNPLCGQVRMFSTTSGSIFSSARYRANTASCQAACNRSRSSSGSSRNSPSGVNSPQVTSVWMCGCQCRSSPNGAPLDRSHHAGHHVVAAQQASDFGLDARPDARAELAQQLAVEAGVQPQTLGDGQHDLPVGDGRTDLLGHVNRDQQGPFLVAGRTRARACRRKTTFQPLLRLLVLRLVPESRKSTIDGPRSSRAWPAFSRSDSQVESCPCHWSLDR